MKRIGLLSTAIVFGCWMAIASAQQNPPPGGAQPANPNTAPAQPGAPTEQAAPGTPAGQTGDRRFSFNADAAARQMATFRSADSDLAACLTIDNEGEVFAAQFALQHSQNEDVKQFAQQMITDHTQMIQNLQRFTGAAGAAATSGNSAATNQTPAEQQRTADANAINNQTAQAATAPAPAANVQTRSGDQNPTAADAGRRPLDHVALKRELGEVCKQTLQREWSQKSGVDFDMCYVGHQIGAHLHAIDSMKVAQNHAGPELRQTLDEGIRTAEGHLKHVKELAKKVEGQFKSAKGG